jgi:hypothetical protein
VTSSAGDAKDTKSSPCTATSLRLGTVLFLLGREEGNAREEEEYKI